MPNNLTNNFFLSGNITAAEATASSWVITPKGLIYNYTDKVDKSDRGKPLVRSLIYLAPNVSNTSLNFVSQNKTVMIILVSELLPLSSELLALDPSEYDVYLGDDLLEKKVSFRLGGVYTIVGSNVPRVISKPVAGKTITVTQPNSLHMAVMLPQYIILTMAEVMFSVTGLEFAFTQAPKSMKSLLQAGWLLSVAFGNLIVVIVKGSHPFQRQVNLSRLIKKSMQLIKLHTICLKKCVIDILNLFQQIYKKGYTYCTSRNLKRNDII